MCGEPGGGTRFKKTDPLAPFLGPGPPAPPLALRSAAHSTESISPSTVQRTVHSNITPTLPWHTCRPRRAASPHGGRTAPAGRRGAPAHAPSTHGRTCPPVSLVMRVFYGYESGRGRYTNGCAAAGGAEHSVLSATACPCGARRDASGLSAVPRPCLAENGTGVLHTFARCCVLTACDTRGRRLRTPRGAVGPRRWGAVYIDVKEARPRNVWQCGWMRAWEQLPSWIKRRRRWPMPPPCRNCWRWFGRRQRRRCR
jgi:hypothetical protein